MLTLPPGEGVLAHQHLLGAIDDGVIDAESAVPAANVQPASIDLRLGPVAYPVRCSFLPDTDPVERKLAWHKIAELDLRGDGAILEVKRPYLIPLQERLALPPAVRAKANPKSSTGRADVFTRVISDYSDRFDEVAAGYQGPLYLEVVPLSFPIRVREDLALNQLRLSVGQTALSDGEVRRFHADVHPLLYKDGRPVDPDRLMLAGGLFLGLDLRGDKDRRVGYRAKEHAPLLDLSSTTQDPKRFWEPVEREDGNRIVLIPQRFYLLMSNEAVAIPPQLASEMTAYDPTSGELRTHYAGFFDPGFGYDPAGTHSGSRAALEVRAHDVPFMIEHGQRVCKLTFDRMLAAPDQLYGDAMGSNYQRQDETLSKHFVKPRRRARPGSEQPELLEVDG
ncbi:MAG TPA: 2'-deoxycytidine 5'-triphosphate deaminase [Acidimicrobiales bacterium]|nr:2'-deoxycytidine 5'-triphosphate deaminase [Acidimicrobiales bacterium]